MDSNGPAAACINAVKLEWPRGKISRPCGDTASGQEQEPGTPEQHLHQLPLICSMAVRASRVLSVAHFPPCLQIYISLRDRMGLEMTRNHWLKPVCKVLVHVTKQLSTEPHGPQRTSPTLSWSGL